MRLGIRRGLLISGDLWQLPIGLCRGAENAFFRGDQKEQAVALALVSRD